uniref:Fucosyltransferase n=1 Tax=Cyprinus carpio TaxID=7962 RepID=A0A8C1Z6N6_CYPCA
MLWKCCVFNCESETTLFGLPKEDDFRFVMPGADPCWSLRKYINFALWIAESAFTVDEAETFTPSKGNKAHRVLINHSDIKSDLLNLPTKPQPFLQKWIWMHFESPRNTRRLDGLENLFNVTLIYRRDADIIFPKVLDKKDKLVCRIVGNWNEKHERVKYYNELKKHINIYAFGASGSCGSTIHERFVLKDAFIHVKDFSSPQKLAEHLLSLDKNVEEYKKYFQRRKHFEVKLVNNPQECACCSCQYIQTKKDYQVFGNLNKWYWIVIKDGT